jgi:UbiD family decarboxylase
MRDYLARLEDGGSVARVRRSVDPRHELAAVTKASQRRDDRAVRFDSVAGTRMAVATNVYGSHRRLCDLIGATPSTFCRRWWEIVDGPMPDAAVSHPLAERPDDLEYGSLDQLPWITWHGLDAAPYITAAVFLAHEPDTGVANLSFHRAMYVSPGELRVRLGTGHDLTRYQAIAEQRNEPLEAVMLIGVDPCVFLAACASPPYEVSELDVAAKLAQRPIATYPCRQVGLRVPVGTEVVIEGRILPKVRRPEGPFGEFMGFYIPVTDNHVFEVLDVYWRREAIFHGILCGSPDDLRPLEAVTAARIYKHVSSMVRGVLDVCCRPNVMITIIRIRKQYEGHAGHVMLAALGSHLDYNKVVIVVDEDVDIHNLDDVMWAYLTRGRADTRAQIIHDVPGFYRDPHKDHWGRLLIDATIPWGREADFRRKAIPGEDSIDLAKYLE